MVVAKFHRQRWLGRLRSGLLGLLLHDETGNNRNRPDSHVFRLHRTDGADVLAANRDDWLLRGVRIYPENLRGRQDRLVKFTIDSGI